MGRVQGKVAFVTGAARGLGRRHAVRLAEEGADIIAVDAGPDAELAETANLVEAAGRHVVAVDADVRDLGALTAAAEKGAAEFGRLDIVVADAGDSGSAPTLDMSEQSWQDMIDVNFTGVWKTLKAAVPHLVRGGRGGAVVITGSLPAMHAAPNSAAKAGLVVLMKELAVELAPYEIRVNIVHPRTPATGLLLDAETDRLFRGGVGGGAGLGGGVGAGAGWDRGAGAGWGPGSRAGGGGAAGLDGGAGASWDPGVGAGGGADWGAGPGAGAGAGVGAGVGAGAGRRAAVPDGTRTLTRLPVAVLDPEDITNAVLYLVSDDGCYVTGTTHVVDVCGAP